MVSCLLLASVDICRAINYRPYFTKTSLVKTIPENVGPGYFIADISLYAKDDENDAITYGLDSYGKEICSIGLTSGRLTLKKRLDREENVKFKIIVSAEDDHQGGGQHRTAYLPVHLYVLDANDNKPVFLNTPYLATVFENATVGTTILQVEASDKDEGRNADVEYIFKSGQPTDDFFKIDGDTGIITLAKALDYETEKKHTLVVIARDKGTPQTLESQTTVIIDVKDIRDTNPRFLHTSYQKQIDENLPVGTSVVKVTAVDGDREVNHPINYSFEDGNDEGLFYIEKTTGIIRTNGTIDREISNIFKIKVKAYEENDATACAYVDVIILVNDVNDNKPHFLKSHFVFTVQEDAPIGYVLADQLSATDADIDKQNKRYEFSLEGANGMFSIHPFSGRLQVASQLDYEKKISYKFNVVAREIGTKEKFEGRANITVNVINVNDNAPSFERLAYIFLVQENVSTEKVVGRVKATDDDVGSFGKVSYEIKSNMVGSPLFSINSQTGEIFAARRLDYSKKQTHNFVVIAKDQGGQASKQSRTLVQVVLIEVLKPTTKKLTTKIIETRERTSTEQTNEVPEVRQRTDVLLDQEKVASSASIGCILIRPLLLTTIILALRALVT